MNASWSYLTRNLGRRRTRTIVGALGIFFTIALLTAIQIGFDSISVSYIELVSLQAGKADVLITTPGGDFMNRTAFDPAKAEQVLAKHPHLRGISPRLVGIVQVGRGNADHYALLIGLDPARERELDISGLLPAPRLEGTSCVISRALAARLKIKPGSNISVTAPNNYSQSLLRLEAEADRQMLVPQEVQDFIVVNLASAREILGESDRVHYLAGGFRDARRLYDARDLHHSALLLKRAGAEIASALGMDYDVRLPRASAISAFENFTSPLRASFGVFALLALTVTGLLIYSLISVAVEERIREYAILRTLGAKQRDIFRLVLGESLLLCSLGVLPGVVGGALFAKVALFLATLALKSKGAAIDVEISPGTLLLTLGGGALLSVASALVPAIQATRRTIVDALDPLRQGQVIARRNDDGAARGLLFAGVALTALSVVVFFVLPNAFLSGNPSLVGTVILCLLLSILLGLTLIMMGALPLIQAGLFRLLRPVLGAPAELASRNLRRHSRRHATTALLFTLSVSLVLFVASLVALFSRTALLIVEHTHGADVRVYAANAGNENLRSELSRVEGVRSAAEARFLHHRSPYGTAYDVVASDLVGMKSLWLVPFGVDRDLCQTMYTNRIVWESGDLSALLHLAGAGQASASGATNALVPPVILSQAAARYLDVDAGDDIQLAFHLGSERTVGRFHISGVCSAFPGLPNFRARLASAVGSGLLMSLPDFKRMAQPAPSDAFQAMWFLRAAGAASEQKALAKRVREQFDVRYRFGVQSTAEQKENARAMYWATQVFFGLLLGVALVIAVFALIASMASTVMERRREAGVMKALGMRNRELFRVFASEAVVLTLSAGIGGGIIGFSLAWLFVAQATVLMEVATVFTMPYLTFIAMLGISVFAGVLAAYIPARALLRHSAGEILRQ